MALLHQAELRPSKLELVGGWAPSQPWFGGDPANVGDLASVGTYRFDDPDGEVGVETLLLRAANGPILQVPLTYRGVPLADADEWLIGTLRHSVLGTRWVYDGAGDPVYLLAVATAIIAGEGQADLYVDVDGVRVKREPTATVSGSGIDGASVPAPPRVDEIVVHTDASETVVETGRLRITVSRVLDGNRHGSEPGAGVLTGTWSGQPEPLPLVFASIR